MRFRLWPFVSFSFAILLALVSLFAWLVTRKTTQIDNLAAEAHRKYQRADNAVTNIRADVYRAALLAHDVDLEPRTPALQHQLFEIRAATDANTRLLGKLLTPAERSHLDSLRRELTGFWHSLGIASTEPRSGEAQHPTDRGEQREAVLKVAEQIDSLNEASIHQQEHEIAEDRQSLRRFGTQATTLLVILSLCVALGSISYLAVLERQSEKERLRAEDAEFELRRLSQQLVRTQEEERRTISRELHDEVGQILTGLRMELGTLTSAESAGVLAQRVDSVKALTEEALRTVRNLALLLRPSMLDDLGLAPALRWQAKEFSRRMGVPISVDIEGSLDQLSEAHRICLYRAVQEALTNSARHAEASRITVKIAHKQDVVTASIVDNGKGFPDKQLRTRGLGLAGMEERVRALQGTLTVSSHPGQGTELQISLPVYAEPTRDVPVTVA